MTRVDIFYGGRPYSIGHRSVDEVQAEIDEGLDAQGRVWLTVNHGEGRLQITRLLITAGVDIALVDVEITGDGADDGDAGDGGEA